jgi:hypothetical protein
MTDRLSTLLAAEAESVAVPEARPELIVRRARAMRLRRRGTRSVVGIAAAAVIATGIGLVNLDDDRGTPASAQARFENAAATPAYGTYGAFAAGRTVYIGNHRVTFEEKIKSIYYTSEGVLVRMGRHAYTDESGPSHYTLIRPDGSTKQIALHMGDRVPATDPESPDVAYLEPTGDSWSFVVVDLRTGHEVARKTVDGSFTWGGWEAPPVTMAGTRVWGLFDEGWREFDWSTGTTRLVPGTAGADLEAAHGRYAALPGTDGPRWDVVDFATGKPVRTVTGLSEMTAVALSPNGRFLRIGGFINYDEKGNLAEPPSPSRFLDLDTGKSVTIAAHDVYGWTPQGNTLSVDPAKDRITVCDPVDGSCDKIDLKIGSGTIKLGGAIYES